MRIAFLFVCFFFSIRNSFPQDTLSNTSKNNAFEYYGISIIPDKKIEVRGKRYRFEQHSISEKDVHHELLRIRDNNISVLVAKANQERKKQYIGFTGVPLAIGAYVSLIMWELSYEQNPQSPNNNYLLRSGLLAMTAFTFPIYSMVNKHKRRVYTREAVKLYNQKF